MCLLEDYKQKKLESLVHHQNKSKRSSSLRMGLRPSKLYDRVQVVENFCGMLKKDKEFCKIFEEPFKVKGKKVIRRGDETYEELAKKIGPERLVGMVQGYQLALSYCKA